MQIIFYDVCRCFFILFEKYWKRTKFCKDLFHAVMNVAKTILRDHPDREIFLEDLMCAFRRLKFPNHPQNV